MSPRKVGQYVGIDIDTVGGDDTETSAGPTVDDERERLARVIRRVLKECLHATIKAVPGTGKSTICTREIVDAGMKMLWLAPTHQLLLEQLERLQDLGAEAEHLAKFYDIEPRCEDVEAGDGSHDSRAEEIRFRENIGESKYKTCATCPLNKHSDAYDDGRTPCEALQTADRVMKEGDHALVASAYLGHPDMIDEMMEDRDVIVVDETAVPWLRSVQAFRIGDLKRISELDEKLYAEISEMDSDASDSDDDDTEWDVLPLGDVISQIRRGHVPPEMDLLSDDRREWVGGSDRIQDVSVGSGPEIGIEVDDGLIGIETPSDDRPVHVEATRFLNAVRRGVSDVDVLEYDGERYVVLHSQHTPSPDHQWIFLDATITEHARRNYDAMLGKVEHIDSVPVNRDTEVLHDPSSSWSREAQGRIMTKHKDEDYEGYDRYANLRDLLASEMEPYERIVHDEETGEEAGLQTVRPRVGIVTQGRRACRPTEDGEMAREASGAVEEYHQLEQVGEQLVEDLDIDDTIGGDVLHWGDMRGKNTLEEYDVLAIIGGPAVNGLAYVLEGLRWGMDVEDAKRIVHLADGYRSQPPEGIDAERYVLRYEALSPWSQIVDGDGRGKTPPKLAREVFTIVVRASLEQAIGRPRGINRNVKIYLLSAHDPTGVPAYHDYRIDPDLLSDESTANRVMDADVMERAEYLLWQTGYSRRRIAEGLEVDRKTLDKIGPDEDRRRAAMARRIVGLRSEGKSMREVAEAIPGMSKSRVGRSLNAIKTIKTI